MAFSCFCLKPCLKSNDTSELEKAKETFKATKYKICRNNLDSRLLINGDGKIFLDATICNSSSGGSFNRATNVSPVIGEKVDLRLLDHAFQNKVKGQEKQSKSAKSRQKAHPIPSSFNDNNYNDADSPVFIRADGVIVVTENDSATTTFNKPSPKINTKKLPLNSKKIQFYQTCCYPNQEDEFSRFSFFETDKKNAADALSTFTGPSPLSKSIIKIDKTAQGKKQKILGFGGALTDAACINLNKLTSTFSEKLMKVYFGKDGAEYSIVRAPISSCDFSARTYTYLDTEDDFDCKTFQLQPEDDDKIKWLKTIREMSEGNQRLVNEPLESGASVVSGAIGSQVDFLCSSWTAPLWMKTNRKWAGRSTLIGQPGDKYHKCWAKYLSKFLQEYEKANITFKYMTIQNEPTNGYAIPAFWQSLGWSPEHMKNFISKDFIPQFLADGHFENGKTKILMLDDIRLWLPYRPDKILDSPENKKYISGIGTHWYMNYLIGTRVLDETHEKHPEQFILGTEACHEKVPAVGKLNLAEQWERGQKYSNDIIACLNHWQTGWIDWNLILDASGGPNWASNQCDSPIVVIPDENLPEQATTFLVQPMVYHMAHFSKLIKKGDVVLKTLVEKTNSNFWEHVNVVAVACCADDGKMVVTILNKDDQDRIVYLEDLDLEMNLERKSLTSVVYYSD